MATTTTFDAALKRYMPYDLLVAEMKRRNYFWNKVAKDDQWLGGTLEVPFEGAEASSLRWGSLTASNDIAEGEVVVGTVSTQPELWGTMLFNEKDLDRHAGNMEASYLKILPGKINQFMKRMSERISIQLLGDGAIAKATGNGDASGNIAVDQPQLFTLKEKVVVDDDDTGPVTGYVQSIDLNTGNIQLDDARSAGAAVDLSLYTTLQNAKVFLPDAQANGMTSLKSQLLSATNGGGATIAGVTKTAYPHMQARNISGAAYTANTLTNDVFKSWYEVLERGNGNPSEIVMSFGNFKHIAKDLETNRQFKMQDQSAGYGFRSLDLIGPEGEMKISAVRDMPSDVMYVMDWDALKFHGSKFFDRKRHDNSEFFLIRGTSGYQYVVDIKFYGDLIVNNPSNMGIIHSVPSL